MFNPLINFSDIRSANRLDAEYFQQKYLKLHKKLKVGKYSKLHDLCEFIQTGPAGSMLPSANYISNGIKIIRPSNLDNWTCHNGNFVYVSFEDCLSKKLKLYRSGDILITRIGDIKFGIIDDVEKVAISPNLIAVRTISRLLDPYFLLAFLNSKFGFDQIHRGAKIVSLASIDTGQIANLQVPTLSPEEQAKIGRLIKKSIEEKEDAKKIYADAENKLLKSINYLETDNFIFSGNFKLSNLQQSHRSDAEYFINKNNMTICHSERSDSEAEESHSTEFKKIKNSSSNLPDKINTIKLGEICKIIRGIDPGRKAYQNNGKLFLRTSNITKFGLINKSQKYISENLFKKLSIKYQPVPGEILLVKDGNPGIALVINKLIEGINSDGIVRLQLNNSLSPEYVALCINSPFCKDQISSDKDGSLVPHWKVEQIKKLQIPVIDPVIQKNLSIQMKKISSLFNNAQNNLTKAKLLLNEIIN